MNQGVMTALRNILARKSHTTGFQGYYGRLLQSNAYAPTADEARRDVEERRAKIVTSWYGL
ncbi:MAG: hypothetical protein HYX94_12550 [Chloroflexi bacterium]|nr:hypothetical protein [Chloroflexota bacterium]